MAIGRPREFEENEALSKALTLFRDKGYERTSLDELLAAMALSKSSFYQAFGSKRALYLRAIDRFRETDPGISGVLDHRPGLPGIVEVFDDLVRRMSSKGPRWGCFFGRVSMEMGRQDDEAAARAAKGFRLVAKRFERAIAAAQLAGEVRKDRTPRFLAHSLTSTFYGLQVLGRANVGRAMLENVKQAALAQLE